ncbi:EAL and HDOD domain-containing protein [Hydrogenimonas sp.]
MDAFYIARQPIVDRNNRIFGYEILFRGNRPGDDVDGGTVMTATAINNLINVIGVENVIGQHRGIVKITPLFLKRKLIEALPKERLIFAFFEEDIEDPSLIEAIEAYREKGYTFAINDLHDVETIRKPHILDLIDYIKIDHEALDEETIEKIIRRAKEHGIQTVCSKIETRSAHQTMYEMGCDFFQGYFFKEPELLEEYPIHAETGGILLLWNLIRNNASTDELVEAFEREHTITLQLLRFINSPFFSLRQTVTSIRHLIALLGRNQLSQWLLVMLFAKETQKEGGNHPLVLMVINRTELMVGLLKLIEPDVSKSEEETAYLVGMLSLVHLIFHRPPREILHHLHVSEEIEKALFEAQGLYGRLLNMVRIIENNDIEKLNKIVMKYHLSPEAINRLSLEAMKKVNAFDEALKEMKA